MIRSRIFRETLTTKLAKTFENFLQSGKLPDYFATAKIIPLSKQ